MNSAEKSLKFEMKFLLSCNSFKNSFAHEISLLFLSYLTSPLCMYFAQQFSMTNIVPFSIPFSKSFSIFESEYYSHHYSCLPMCFRCWKEISWQNQILYSHLVKLEMKCIWLKTSSRKVFLARLLHSVTHSYSHSTLALVL